MKGTSVSHSRNAGMILAHAGLILVHAGLMLAHPGLILAKPLSSPPAQTSQMEKKEENTADTVAHTLLEGGGVRGRLLDGGSVLQI